MKESVFLAIVSPLILGDMYNELTGKTIPTVLMVNRWDGKIGFPGGFIDEGETPEQAIVREVLEELNVSIDSSLLEYEGIKDGKHLFVIHVSSEFIKDIFKNIHLAEHFQQEITGLCNVHLEDYNEKGFQTFLNNCFSGTALDQLINLEFKLKNSPFKKFN